MGSVGDAYDNAMCESFFATLETELLQRKSLRNQAEARTTIFDFIEGLVQSAPATLVTRSDVSPQLQKEVRTRSLNL